MFSEGYDQEQLSTEHPTNNIVPRPIMSIEREPFFGIDPNLPTPEANTIPTVPSGSSEIESNNFQFIQESFDETGYMQKRIGKRRGPLSTEAKNSANSVRAIGVCCVHDKKLR